MDPDDQERIKALAQEHGAEHLIVVLGAADAEALEVAAETVTSGDPAYVGPLAGVQLGLDVRHVFELKEAADPAVYQAQVGFIELAVDAEEVREVMRRFRAGGVG